MSIHWLTSCSGKLKFATWHAANRVLRERRRKARVRAQPHKQARAERAHLSIYRCRHCQHWHIGGH